MGQIGDIGAEADAEMTGLNNIALKNIRHTDTKSMTQNSTL